MLIYIHNKKKYLNKYLKFYKTNDIIDFCKNTIFIEIYDIYKNDKYTIHFK
jgi:hypothetical protein